MLEVVAGIIFMEDKFLIAKRNAKKSQGNLWEFPGGKVEMGESYPEALKREIKEELNANIEVEKYLGDCIHQYSDKVIKLIGYKAKLLSKNIEMLEHEDYCWISIEELKCYDLADADRKLIEKMGIRKGEF